MLTVAGAHHSKPGLTGSTALRTSIHVRLHSQSHSQSLPFQKARSFPILQPPPTHRSHIIPSIKDERRVRNGRDYKHWFIVMEPPPGNPTRAEIINTYISTLAHVLGSKEEARMKIYSVSTKHYYAFGCEISEELSYKLKCLPNVEWVLPDSYLDPRTKSYGGEPFVNGHPVPYDPKYHEEWVRNSEGCNKTQSAGRPQNFDQANVDHDTR